MWRLISFKDVQKKKQTYISEFFSKKKKKLEFQSF